MNILTWEVFLCQKAYKDQCQNKIWLNEEAQVRQRVPDNPQTPTGPKQRDIVSYFPKTPSTNPDNRGAAKMGAESGGKPNGRQADGSGITHLSYEGWTEQITDEAAVLTGLKRSSTPTPLARTPSKKTKVETPLLATPESRDQTSARSNRSHTSDPNYGIDDSPCSKKHIRNIDSKENHVRNGDTSVAMCLGEQNYPNNRKGTNFVRKLSEVLSTSDGNKP